VPFNFKGRKKRSTNGLKRVDEPVKQMVAGTYKGSQKKTKRNRRIDDAIRKAMGY